LSARLYENQLISVYIEPRDDSRQGEIIMKRVALYIRVSTSKQDTANQLRELSAVADRSGWEIWNVYEDAGISGAKGWRWLTAPFLESPA